MPQDEQAGCRATRGWPTIRASRLAFHAPAPYYIASPTKVFLVYTRHRRPLCTTALILTSVVAMPACVRSGAGASAPTAGPPLPRDIDFVQYRWIDTMTPPTATPFVDPQSGEPLALSDSVWLDISGIDSVWVWQPRHGPDSTFDVLVLHSREASAQVGAATATHIGRRAAVVIDGVVANVFTLCGALGAKSELASYSRRSDADSLAARVDRAASAIKPYRPVYFRRGSVRELVGHAASGASDGGRTYPPPLVCTH